jgi:hypothetical protein
MTNVEITTSGNGRRRTRRIPDGEKREDKFVRLALYRVGKVKKTAQQIEILATYPHTEEQADKIIDEMKTITAEIEAAFARRRRTAEFKF